MDSFQFVENQLYPSAPASNDVNDLSIKVSSSHRDIEYFDNVSYKVLYILGYYISLESCQLTNHL